MALTGVGASARAGTFWDDNDYVIANGPYLLVLNEDFTFKAVHQFPSTGFVAGSLDWLPNGDLVIAVRGDWDRLWYHTCDSDGNVLPAVLPYVRPTGSSWLFEVKVAPQGTEFFASGLPSSGAGRTERIGASVLQWVNHDNFCGANAVITKADGSHELWVGNGCDLGGIAVYPLAADGSILKAGRTHIGLASVFHSMTFDPAGRRVLYPRSIDCSTWHEGVLQDGILAVQAETRTLDRVYSVPADQLPSTAGVWFTGVTAGEHGRVVGVESWPLPGVGTKPLRLGLSVWNQDGTGYRFINLAPLAGFDPVPWYAESLAYLANIVWTGNSPEFRNRPPGIECPDPVVVDCVPAAGLPLDITVVVSDADPDQSLTVSLAVGATLIQQTLATPVSGGQVTFSGVVLSPGQHDLTFEVSDGKATVSCPTRIQMNPYSAPTLLSSPADVTVECGTIVSFGLPSFHSDCDDDLMVTAEDEALPVSDKQIRRTRRTWTATDHADQAVTASQTITVVDTTAPTFTSVPHDLSLEATDTTGAVVHYPAAVATDGCGDNEVAYSQASGTLFPVGTTTVLCTATDRVGNQATASFTVTVETAPLPGPIAQLDALMSNVEALPVDAGAKSALLAGLNLAKKALTHGRTELALRALAVFDRRVNALAGAGQLTSDQAEPLKDASANIGAAIGAL